MSLAEFKSSPARVVLMLTRSREKWKQRVAAKQDEIRRLRVKVRDLEVSRAYWKKRALTPPAQAAPQEDLGPGKAPASPR
jgi:hypothetical protein